MRSFRRSLPRASRLARRTGFRILVVAGVLAIAVACTTSTSGGATPAVSDVWVRPPMGEGRPAAGYLTMVGADQADALIAASSPVAGKVEIHETTADASGMAAMHPVDRIDVGAGATVRLEPGGYHLMLMDVTEDLVPGGTVEITLEFEHGGEMTVQAEIRQG